MRTTDELLQKIDDDLIWRRRELTDLRAAVQSARSNASYLIRAGVALLYAHWEGFIKRCGTYYLQFVNAQRLKGSELQRNFVALKLRGRLLEAAKSHKPSAYGDVVDFFCTQLDNRLRIPHRNVVDTESNLSSTVLREILWDLGLDMAPYETKVRLIDSSLVDRRNHIAHGDVLDINVDDYFELHDEVLTLLDTFRNQLQNAAVTTAFMKVG